MNEPRFRLTRYFSLVSLLVVAAIGALLSWQVQQRAEAELLHMAERRNEAMAAVFVNALWQEFAPQVRLRERSPEVLRAHAAQAGWQAKSAALMAGSQIIKVKVFDLQGMTVFSSDPQQIGEDKRSNPGFLAASSGKPASTLTHRDRFDAFEGTRSDIDVIGSYVPVRENGVIVGVLETYQDVTGFVQRLRATARSLLWGLGAAMALLYGLQLLFVRRAQHVLDAQGRQLRDANDELEGRVAARTAELEQARARLDHLAHHDPLTGLPNRLLCSDHLRRACATAERQQRQLALLYIDLDRFKEINDAQGHAVGDEVLKEVSRRLSALLRRAELLARIGGDEFVCVLDCQDAAREAPQLAHRLIEALFLPVLLAGQEFQVSASIGISLYPGDGQGGDALFHAADAAMYAAKAEGRNRYQFYRPELTAAALDRSRMVRLLRRALAEGELSLAYQMKLSCSDARTPAGAEALLRWHSAELGAVPPGRFISVAEESGLIVELGAWVLEQACQQLVRWDSEGLPVPHVSVNVSVRQLERGDFVDHVRAVLQRSGLAPGRLELEITESVIMKTDNALEALAALDCLGVRLSVDDFGTGYSSLAYLKQMPIETLKIDRSFVSGIGEQQGDEAIIRTVIALARSLGLSTVAEGVETQAQLDFLRREGCEQVQGFLLSRPLAEAPFGELWRVSLAVSTPPGP
ncbi:putative bifunctional diguanylate cyclase/phosphodiesterase [Roseateles sp. LYH14W]|uniref:Bifunctional diguanylate cyclase/phosphodiesterase n=1 Tax=Pelomonas parva TaxID=3299032 RepID=A0ABW7F201_9BURK